MKKAEKQMRREKVVSAGKQYAPTLYTVLVNPDDDQRLFGFYPTCLLYTSRALHPKCSSAGPQTRKYTKRINERAFGDKDSVVSTQLINVFL